MANALSGCVASLQSSIALLDSSITILDAGVNDFPRLSKTLQTTRHFELLPETTLQTAQSQLLASITPEIQSLLGRVESHLDRLARREQSLIAKCELLAGRLGEQQGQTTRPRSKAGGASSTAGAATAAAAPRTPKKDASGEIELDREALRMKQLRQKKERLSFAVERLTLQAQQKERQLRMSMAAQQE